MNMTRLRVNKIFGQVREDGAVQIEVTLPMVACVELGEALATRHGVSEALVVPDHLEQKRVIGEAAGALAGALIEGRDLGVGIATGRTLSFAVRGLQTRPHVDSWVVGLPGGVTRSSGTNTYEVATSFARKMGVECPYLTAPALLCLT